MYVYIYVHFFAVCVACTLEHVFWALVHGQVFTEHVFWTLVHGQVFTLHRCVFYTNVHICDTLAAGCVHMCIFIYMCICRHMYMDAYVLLWYCLTRWGVVTKIFSVCTYVCICMCMYMCLHVCVYVCVHVYMYVYVYVYICAYLFWWNTFIYTRVWVYICTCVGAFCLFVLSNLSATCACITGVS